MEPKNSKIFNKITIDAVSSYCKVNNIEDVDDFMYKCFKQGFDIKKYGLLGKTLNEGEEHLKNEVDSGKTGGEQEKRVEIEVIREIRVEVPVEVIKEVEKVIEVVKEVPVEKIVEVIKEVPIEKIVEVTKEIPVDRVVVKEVVKEVPVEVVVTKTEYVSDDTQINELLLKIQQLEEEISTKTNKMGEISQEFSTKTTEMENIFQNKMSKKDEELDELRRNLDIILDKPPVEKIIEVEKIVEKVVEKPNDKSKLLETTLQNLRKELSLKNEKINELETKNKQLESINIDRGAVYMKGSNLTQNL